MSQKLPSISILCGICQVISRTSRPPTSLLLVQLLVRSLSIKKALAVTLCYPLGRLVALQNEDTPPQKKTHPFEKNMKLDISKEALGLSSQRGKYQNIVLLLYT